MRKSCMANVELNYSVPPYSVVTCTCDPDAVSHSELMRTTALARMTADLKGGYFAGA